MQLTRNQIITIAAAILLLCALYQLSKGKGQSSVKSADLSITLYSSPTCPYCKRFTPVWKDLKKKMNFAKYKTIDCSKNAGACKGIAGVPTMVVKNRGKETMISGAVTLEDALDRIHSFVVEANN